VDRDGQVIDFVAFEHRCVALRDRERAKTDGAATMFAAMQFTTREGLNLAAALPETTGG
jgi:hypothetical protein